MMTFVLYWLPWLLVLGLKICDHVAEKRYQRWLATQSAKTQQMIDEGK